VPKAAISQKKKQQQPANLKDGQKQWGLKNTYDKRMHSPRQIIKNKKKHKKPHKHLRF